jgi:hypothetical protein
MYDGTVQPWELTPWIIIAYFRLPGWANLGFCLLLKLVITIDAVI